MTRPEWLNCFYTRSSGIWQTVWLEPVEAAYIKDLKITPDALARPEALGIPERAPVVGSVGRFVPFKGYPFLLQAARTVEDVLPEGMEGKRMEYLGGAAHAA